MLSRRGFIFTGAATLAVIRTPSLLMPIKPFYNTITFTGEWVWSSEISQERIRTIWADGICIWRDGMPVSNLTSYKDIQHIVELYNSPLPSTLSKEQIIMEIRKKIEMVS